MLDARLPSRSTPDETTILRFRRLPEQHKLCGMILDTMNHCLAGKGLRISTRSIVLEARDYIDDLAESERALVHLLRILPAEEMHAELVDQDKNTDREPSLFDKEKRGITQEREGRHSSAIEGTTANPGNDTLRTLKRPHGCSIGGRVLQSMRGSQA